MNNKIKSILLACLMLVGVNAVKADNIPVTPGTYYFDFSKVEGGVVYGADVFRNINSTEYLELDVSDQQPCNTGLTATDGTNFQRGDGKEGFSKIVVGVEEGAALTQENFLQVKLHGVQNDYTSVWIKYSEPTIGNGEFYGEVQSDNTLIWKELPEGFCESYHNLTYYVDANGDATGKYNGTIDIELGVKTPINSGAEVTLTATVNDQDYEFDYWMDRDSGLPISTDAIWTFRINRTMSVQAKFKPKGTDSPLTGECEDCFYVTP